MWGEVYVFVGVFFVVDLFDVVVDECGCGGGFGIGDGGVFDGVGGEVVLYVGVVLFGCGEDFGDYGEGVFVL